jgi:hypothetical protein
MKSYNTQEIKRIEDKWRKALGFGVAVKEIKIY